MEDAVRGLTCRRKLKRRSSRRAASYAVTQLADSGVTYQSLQRPEDDPVLLKQTIGAAVMLLQPAQTLSIDPFVRLGEIRTRLEESKAAMPENWAEERGWDSASELENPARADSVVARRAMDLMLELQRFLELEFVAGGSRFSEKDCKSSRMGRAE